MKKYSWVLLGKVTVYVFICLCSLLLRGVEAGEEFDFNGDVDFQGLIYDFSWGASVPSARDKLKELGEKDDKVIEKLAEILVADNKNWIQEKGHTSYGKERAQELQGNIIRLLGKFGPRGKIALPAMMKILNDKEAYSLLPGEIFGALREMDLTNDELLPLLEAGAKYEDVKIRDSVRGFIGQRKFEDPVKVSLLLTILRNSKNGKADRMYVINDLAKLDPFAKEAIPYLKQLLKEEANSLLPTEILRALRKMDLSNDEWLPFLEAGAMHGDQNVREWFRNVISERKFEDPVKVSLLLSASRNPKNYESDRMHIVEALGKLGPSAKEAIPYLKQLLKSAGDDEEADSIIRALGEIGGQAEKQKGDLIEKQKRDLIRKSATARISLLVFFPCAAVLSVFYFFVLCVSRSKKLPIGIKLVAAIDLVTGCAGAIAALFFIYWLYRATVPVLGFGSVLVLGLIIVPPGLVVSAVVGFLGITTWERVLALDSKSRTRNLVFLAPALIIAAGMSYIYLAAGRLDDLGSAVSFFFGLLGLLLVFVLNMPSIRRLFTQTEAQTEGHNLIQ